MKIIFQNSSMMHETWIGTKNYQSMTNFVWTIACQHLRKDTNKQKNKNNITKKGANEQNNKNNKTKDYVFKK